MMKKCRFQFRAFRVCGFLMIFKVLNGFKIGLKMLDFDVEIV